MNKSKNIGPTAMVSRDFVASILTQGAERMTALAEKLTAYGSPELLTEDERKTIVIASAPMMQEMFEAALIGAVVRGDVGGFYELSDFVGKATTL